MLTWTCGALAILGCALVAAPTLSAEKTFDRHFNALPGGQLAVDADVGSVAIVGSDARELIVHVDMRGSDNFLARLDVSAVQIATGVIVTERARHRRLSDWFDFTPQNVRFTIEVPRDYPVTINTWGGSLDVSHLKARLHGRTFGGSITMHDVFGPIDTHTFGGSIDATELNGPTELRTFGGSINVANSTGDLDVDTAGGSIRLDDVDGRVTARTSGGDVIAKMRANRGISLRTSGGGITLLLPANVRASIDAHTSGGNAASTIPLSTTRVATHGRLLGDINGGGESIFLRTFGGAIQIAALN